MYWWYSSNIYRLMYSNWNKTEKQQQQQLESDIWLLIVQIYEHTYIYIIMMTIIICVQFDYRSSQGLSILFYIHHIYKGTLGGRKDIGCLCTRIPCPSSRRVRTLHPHRYINGQLWKSANRLSIETQRFAGKHCAQVCFIVASLLCFWIIIIIIDILKAQIYTRYIDIPYITIFPIHIVELLTYIANIFITIIIIIYYIHP